MIGRPFLRPPQGGSEPHSFNASSAHGPQEVSSGTATAPSRAPAAASTAFRAAPPPAAVAPQTPAASKPKTGTAAPERSVVEVIVIRAARILGSLQLAVCGLSTFAAVVLLAR